MLEFRVSSFHVKKFKKYLNMSKIEDFLCAHIICVFNLKINITDRYAYSKWNLLHEVGFLL